MPSLAQYSRAVAAKADVPTHLNERRATLGSLFTEWAHDELGADDRADLLENYLKECDFGEVQRVGNGHSLYAGAESAGPGRATVLVIGRHDVGDLADTDTITPDASLVGPGVAGRVGPTVAFAEGALAARRLVGDGPVNLNFLSLGEGDEFAGVASVLPSRPVDAAYLTNAISWSPHHPTLTIGSRGRLLVQLTLDAGHSVDDFSTSGAFRNPLTKMTQLLGSLRDTNGRIALPGFYDRAHPPDTRVRAAMYDDGHDPDEWAGHLLIARPEGGLSALERATMWPGVSVLGMEQHDNAPESAPGSVTATVAFYLVPDQRPVEIERSVREWFLAACPDDLRPAITVLAAHRPWRCEPETRAVVAQRMAALRLFGNRPIDVPAGGGAGAGEIAFALGAPVAFAGIAPPSRSLGTRRESLSWSHFDAGVELAAETCLQLRRA